MVIMAATFRFAIICAIFGCLLILTVANRPTAQSVIEDNLSPEHKSGQAAIKSLENRAPTGSYTGPSSRKGSVLIDDIFS